LRKAFRTPSLGPEVILAPGMPISPGTKLGPFEIHAPLGAGGMGEVYRATDTRLGRTVAIKVLPERLSQQPDLRRRLENEARTISKLSHPNICTLLDIGYEQGIQYLVLEFVEGQTLRQLLSAGRLPMRRVIPIAVQIAEGLAKAHEGGVVHRDLKPENIMVSAEAVKILDFGIARLSSANENSDGDACTTAANETQPGAILGTFAYMSPEQCNGRPLDFRSDQFSFGLVLYEMVTGQRPFLRPTPAQTILALAQEEPAAIAALNPEVPAPFCWTVERCLAKEPEKRYFSTRDLARDLIAIRDRLSALQSSRPEARPSNLPVPGSDCVGRDKELAAAQALLSREDVRLVTVTGPGGIGKSRLALDAARALIPSFPAGVYFVPLATVKDPQLIPLVIAQALGIKQTPSQAPLDVLQDFLRHSVHAPMLLLIDNFEHLIDAAPVLAALLSCSSNLKILVTSRAPLHVSREHEFPVPPLALPDARALPSLEELAQIPAIALFVARAAAVKPDFVLTEENAPSVADICARLDGLPLAIELAAARAKFLSPSAMRTRLASRLQLLTGGARDLPARQQTLRQAIDWSYDLLTEPEQRLFRRLSAFQGGCTLEAVESVCDTRQDLGLDIFDGMSSMVDKSLVRQVEQADGEPRFVMLETIREYALEKMIAAGEEAAVRRAHAAYCLVLAEEGAAEDDGANRTAWLDRFEIENDNLRSALEWLLQKGNADWGLRLGAALFRFWEMREHLAEGREWFARLLKLPASGELAKPLQRVLFAAGVLAGEQGDYAIGDTLIAESLQLARAAGDDRSATICINARAIMARNGGDLPSARLLFEESLAIWRQLHDTHAIALALSNLASIVKLQEDYPRARALYEECLAIFAGLRDNTGIAWALNHQGDAALQQGDFAAARALYQQSLQKFRELQDRWGIAGTLADLGNLAREQRQFVTSDALYRESLEIFRSLEHKRGVARLLEAFACSFAVQSQAQRALRLAGAAVALRESIGAPLTPIEQAKFERGLEPARKDLSVTAGRTAWLEGWVMPVELAIQDVLASASGSARPSA